MKGRILVAEDHKSIADTYKLMLEAEDYEVTLTGTGDECMKKFDESIQKSKSQASQSQHFDLVILDYHLPGRDGIDVARHVLSIAPAQRILIASSYPAEVIRKSADTLQRSIELLVKPFGLDDFIDAVGLCKKIETVGPVFDQTSIQHKETIMGMPDLQINRRL
jgi:CheY-like chemotaxis protein